MFMVDFIYYERKKDKRKQKMSGKSSMWACKIIEEWTLVPGTNREIRLSW